MLALIRFGLLAIVLRVAESNPIPLSVSLDRNYLLKANNIKSEPFSAGEIRECIASGKNYCESPYTSGYRKMIEQLLRRPDKTNSRMFWLRKSSSSSSAHARGTSPVCSSSKMVIRPTFARDVTDNWIPIVNQDQFRQSVEIEFCDGDDAFLSAAGKLGLADGLGRIGYEPKCVQFNEASPMVGVVNGTLQFRYFSFPSGCSVRAVPIRPK